MGGHPHLIEAETGVQWRSQGPQLFAKQSQHRSGVTGGAPHIQPDPPHAAVHAIKAGLEAASPQGGGFEFRHCLFQQVRQDALHVFVGRDGFKEDAIGHDCRLRPVGRDADVLGAQNARQSGWEVSAEPGRQWPARPIVQVTQPLQPRAAQRLLVTLVQLQGGDRQTADSRTLGLRGKDTRRAKPSQDSRRLGRRGQSAPAVQT
jgi:hypothetical protein